MDILEKLKLNSEILKDTDISEKITYFRDKIISKIHDNKIFFAGNGGSAAQAQHFSTELIVRYNKKFRERSYPCISICSDNVLLSACANDYGYENVFSKQLMGLAKKNDLLILFSTSGNSKNLINAAKYAKKNKIETLSVLGFDGGEMKNLSDSYILVKSNNIAIIQEIHLSIIHSIVEAIDNHLNA